MIFSIVGYKEVLNRTMYIAKTSNNYDEAVALKAKMERDGYETTMTIKIDEFYTGEDL